jgi:type VI secretion system protein VasG
MSLEVDLRALLRKMNKVTTRALNTAVGASSSRAHYELSPDHLLAALLDEGGSDVPKILRHFGIDEARVRKAVARSLETLRAGNPGKPAFSARLIDWIQAGWLHSSVDLGQPEIRSGGLLLAVAGNPAGILSQDYLDLLSPLGRDTLRRDFDAIVAGSSEQVSGHAAVAGRAMSAGAAGDAARPAGAGKRSADSALAKFTVDFTAQAKAGRIDPVFGRDREIRQMVDILGRRRKNNPIVVGEAGVGKTAVVEGLALRVVQGDVPEVLQGVEILSLDLGLLQAGAGVRGEFENRLKSVIEEVKGSEVPVILFIDEAHTLIGAGGAQGGGDAANLLKPALARGELRTIAATTWAEYKKYFETDAALSRRFQPVKLDEPGEDDAVVMLRGLKSHYEAAHKVTIRDDGVVAAVKLSNRYISGRQLPDKAVDLLDTCAARVKVAQAARPARLEDLVKRREALERERDALRRDAATGAPRDPERLARLDATLASIADEAGRIEGAWGREREAARRVLEVRAALAGAPADASLGLKLEEATAALEKAREGDEVYVPLEVDPDTVARTVSDWTGIPLGNMVRDQARAILEFETRMGGRIKGQNHALDAVGRGLRAAKAGIGNPSAPMGVFMFVGPSGVGKTETALGIADLLFGGERFLTSVNMSEYQEKHTVSLLKGSPPGYVGYGEGGVLTEPVRQRPYSVVLLDEVEKAHPDVMNLFYQVFDKGSLTDGTGREIDFKNTIIVLTSNLGTDVITRMCATPVPPDVAELTAAVKPALVQHFKPALNARWTIVPFLTIGPEVMREIVSLKLDRVGRRLMESHRIAFGYDPRVVEQIAARCTEVDTGARNVDHVVQASLLPRISTEILERLTTGDMPRALHLGIAADGGFDLRWDGTAASPAAARVGASPAVLPVPPGVPVVEPGRPAEA